MNPKWAETEATKAQLKVLTFFGYDISEPSSRLDAAKEIKSIFEVRAYRALFESYVKVTGDDDPMNYELLPFDYQDLMPFRWSSWEDLVHNYDLFNPESAKKGRSIQGEDQQPVWVQRAMVVDQINDEGIPFYNGKVEFDRRVFVLTGNFGFGSKNVCKDAIKDLDGRVTSRVSSTTDYLVVGGKGSINYTEGTFGNKIIEAVALKSRKHRIEIITEEHWVKEIA